MSVAVLCRFYFSFCKSLEMVLFELMSLLYRLKEDTFSENELTKKFIIPASVEILCKSCFLHYKSFETIGFESGSKLH
jgi:hypothetical protein